MAVEQPRSNANSNYRYGLAPAVPQNLNTRPANYGEFDFRDTVKAVVGGVIEGFTTIKLPGLSEEPDNEYERIIKQVSHLVGFAPGILASPLTKIGALTSASSLVNLGKSLKGAKGLPLFIGHKAARKGRTVARDLLKGAREGRSDAFATTAKFLGTSKGLGYQARKIIPDVAEGAFSLGIASSISSWQGGVDAMMEGFKGGAMAGGAFKTMGNLIQTGNPKAEKWLRGIAGSLFEGLPAQQAGATTPEIIYSYLAGAYFGANEVPWTKSRAGRFMEGMQKRINKGGKDSELLKQTMDPMIYDAKKYKSLEPEVKTEVDKMVVAQTMGTPDEHHAAMWKIAEETGFLSKIPKGENVTEAVAKNYGNFRKQLSNQKLKQLQGNDYEAVMGQVRYVATGSNSIVEKIVERVAEAEGRNIIRFEGRNESVKDDQPRKIYKVPMEDAEYAESNIKVNEAAHRVGLSNNVSKYTEFQLNNLRKSWAKIANSDSVIGIGHLNSEGKGLRDKRVQSGSIPIQMAIDAKKPVFVFSDNPMNKTTASGKYTVKTPEYSWYKYNYKNQMFEKINNTPQIKDNLTVFGKHNEKEIVSQEVSAIEDIFKVSAAKETVDSKGVKLSDKEEINPAESEYSDLNNTNNSTPLDRKMQGIFHRYIARDLRNLDEYKDLAKLNEKIEQDSKVASDILKKYLVEGKTDNVQSEAWANEVQEKLSIIINPEMRGKMRQYMKRQAEAKVVRFINISEENIQLADSSNPYTLGGRSRLLLEPPRIYEKLYKEAGGTASGDDPVYAVVDNFNYKGQDIEIFRFKGSAQISIYNQLKAGKIKTTAKNLWAESQTLAEAEYTNYLNRLFRAMDKKYDMYPMEGQGDTGKIIFQKHHPNQSKVNISTITNKLKKKKYNFTSDEAKMVRSNIAYALDYNGLKYDKPNVDMLLETNFIKNAFDHNKRSQILNTPMWQVDRKFITDNANTNHLTI